MKICVFLVLGNLVLHTAWCPSRRLVLSSVIAVGICDAQELVRNNEVP